MFRKIRWRIAVPYIALMLLAMLGLSVYFYASLRKTFLRELEGKLAAEAALLADALAPDLASSKPSDVLDMAADHYSALLSSRVTVIATDGTVLGESHQDPRLMDNHADRPEVREALAKGLGKAIRYSETMKSEMMYLAIPAVAEGKVVGIVRVALPLTQINAELAHLRRVTSGATLIAVLLAVALALLIAGRIARPIGLLTQVAERMAEGQLDARFLFTSRDEIGLLARAFNEMARQLQSKIATLAKEKARLDGVLKHMTGGVVITDNEGRVLLINPAAAALLDTSEQSALARPVAQVLKHHQLIEVWQRSRDTGEQQAETAEIGNKLFLQIVAIPLREPDQGFLIILQDLSQVRRLETIRRDFISNVSHELRTPLASLKALVDTLQDGALEDPPAARRFLALIEDEVDAMTQMVQELLELSRIESGRVPIKLEAASVADIVTPPVERLRPQAERKGLELILDLPSDLPMVSADVSRAQQVVSNLVHNAIKYTPGGYVRVSAQRQGDEVIFAVEDTGIGIPAQDLPRIFERFYKADRARASEGAGLGLAIAKHIVQAHGGRIWAESVEGKGSIFRFSLPVA